MVAINEEAGWAVEECGAAHLGDQRRAARLVELDTALEGTRVPRGLG